MVAMSIIVQPKTVMTLSAFLESVSLKLLVRETGTGTWEASFDPEVLEATGEEDDDGDEELTPVVTMGDSAVEAMQALCEFLSGHERLCLDNSDEPLDLHFTKIECDHK